MKKFYSFLLTIGALIQSLFFWLVVGSAVTTKQLDSVGIIGFVIFLIVGLFILSLIGKFVRGLKGWKVIFLNMILSPIRFLAQLIVGILCLANKVEVERGEYDETSVWQTIMFTLCTHSGPHVKYRSTYVPSSSNSSSSRSSSHSSSTSRPSSYSSHDDSSSSEYHSTYHRSDIYSMMRTIADSAKDDVRGEGSAQCIITTKVSFSGTHIYFKINYKCYGTNSITSEYSLNEFNSNIESAANELAYQIQDAVESYFADIEVDEDYIYHIN